MKKCSKFDFFVLQSHPYEMSPQKSHFSVKKKQCICFRRLSFSIHTNQICSSDRPASCADSMRETFVPTGRNHTALFRHPAGVALPTARTPYGRLPSPCNGPSCARPSRENGYGAYGRFKHRQARALIFLHTVVICSRTFQMQGSMI